MRSKPRGFVRRRWVGASVAISWLILYSGLGGVIASAQAASMFALLVATFLALRMPDSTLIHLRRLSGFWGGMALFGVPVAIGMVPIPSGFPEWTTLENTGFHNGSTWHTISVDPEATVTAGALWVLYISLGTFAGIWATRKQFHREQKQLAIAWLVVVLVFAFGHLAFGQHSALGLIATSIGEHRPFFAPFVNDTHLGTMVLYLVPAAAYAVQSLSGPGRITLAAALSCGVLTLLFGISSAGAWGVLALVLLSIVGRNGGTAIRIAAGTLAFTGASVGAVVVHSSPRWVAWREALTLFPKYPINGTGLGGFEKTFAARHSSVEFARWSHLHNDPLQWSLETGLLGMGFGILGLYVLLGFGTLRHNGTASWALGVAAVALHALIEFPAHIPAIFGAVVIALGMMHGGRSREDARLWTVFRIRFILNGLAVAQAAALVWFLRTSVQEVAVAEALAWQQAPAIATAAAGRLQIVAPWRSEQHLVAMWTAEARDETTKAIALAEFLTTRYSGDANVLRKSGLVLLRHGGLEQAENALERAAEL
ncbi:MAG: hypothetical protein GWP91_19335, partial [Rhodobacterales bacterium]|nr:hypothetical protein [Rhodobacterales bacterium]